MSDWQLIGRFRAALIVAECIGYGTKPATFVKQDGCHQTVRTDDGWVFDVFDDVPGRRDDLSVRDHRRCR